MITLRLCMNKVMPSMLNRMNRHFRTDASNVHLREIAAEYLISATFVFETLWHKHWHPVKSLKFTAYDARIVIMHQ